MSARFYFAAAAAAALFAVSSVDARGFRVPQVPNGTELGCGLCHVNPGGGGPRNVFGQMVGTSFLDGGNVVWGPELASLDADGDGATNGEELLDPAGAWRPGDDNPGDAAQVTLPYDAESVPPLAPTAVEASTWAQVKAKVSELLAE